MLKGFVCVISALLCFVATTRVSTQSLRQEGMKIVFEGNRVFSSQRLADETNTCLTRETKSKHGFNQEILHKCIWTLGNFLRGQGYLRAVIGKPTREETRSQLRITVPIEEGSLYRLGSINIRGSRLFSPGQVRELLQLKKGEVVRVDAINDWLFDDLRKQYSDNGHIQYTAEPEARFYRLAPGAREGLLITT